MTTVQATFINSTPLTTRRRQRPLQATDFYPIPYKVTLTFGKLKHLEQGRLTELVRWDEDRACLLRNLTLPETGGFHIAISLVNSPEGSFFTYKLISALGKRRQNGSVKSTRTEAISIDFLRNGRIEISQYLRNASSMASFTNCYAWFYIPLEGAQAISYKLIYHARISTILFMDNYGGKLPGPNMQGAAIIYMVQYIIAYLSPSSSRILTIDASAGNALNDDRLRSNGPGHIMRLSSDGVWRELLHQS